MALTSFVRSPPSHPCGSTKEDERTHISNYNYAREARVWQSEQGPPLLSPSIRLIYRLALRCLLSTQASCLEPLNLPTGSWLGCHQPNRYHTKWITQITSSVSPPGLPHCHRHVHLPLLRFQASSPLHHPSPQTRLSGKHQLHQPSRLLPDCRSSNSKLYLSHSLVKYIGTESHTLAMLAVGAKSNAIASTLFVVIVPGHLMSASTTTIVTRRRDPRAVSNNLRASRTRHGRNVKEPEKTPKTGKQVKATQQWPLQPTPMTLNPRPPGRRSRRSRKAWRLG